MRRFPTPWTIEELDGGFKIVDGNGQTLAYVYGHVDQRDAAIGFAQVARIKSTNPESGGSRPSLGGGSAAKASDTDGRHERCLPVGLHQRARQKPLHSR